MGEDSQELVFVREWDDTGHECAVYSIKGSDEPVKKHTNLSEPFAFDVIRFLKGAFLPAGYPLSVSPDYLRYQIFNVLQAFCSSLAGLIASRAVLEGHGVGNASASATDALLLTILQDIFSRVTTILSAYYLGTSLFPEAKTYRLLADIFNDAAFVLDTLSPHFIPTSTTVSRGAFSYRGLALCISGGLRALCGVAAGGSKAALTMHFSQPANPGATGDIGDLSAKDGSKETVLALLGMLCGSALIPYLRDAYATYSALTILIVAHLLLNYIGVRSVAMRSLNRQRTGILWAVFRGHGSPSARVLTPEQVAAEEYIFASPSAVLRLTKNRTRNIAGYCTIGAPLASILPRNATPMGLVRLFWNRDPQVPPLLAEPFAELLAIHQKENYLIWFEAGCRLHSPHIIVVLKEGHRPVDHLRAWLHASELASCIHTGTRQLTTEDMLAAIREARGIVDTHFTSFLEAISKVGWDLDAAGGGLITRGPRTIRIEQDDRKTK